MKRDLKKFMCLMGVFSMFVFLALGCGSKGGKATEGEDGGDGGETPTPPAESFNFTGTVFDRDGNALPNVEIYAIQNEEDLSTDITDGAGQFSMEIAEEMHTVLGMRDGFINAFRLADLASAEAIEQILLLQTIGSAALSSRSETINARTGGLVELSANVEQGASLSISAQPGGVFSVFDFQNAERATEESLAIGVDYINLTKPLPVPLPTADNLPGTQTPSVLISISPPLMKMETPAELVLPNPEQLSGASIIHFDPYEHRWIEMATTNGGLQESLSISEGGAYGIFYKGNRTATVGGTATPGSYVYVGENIIKVLSDGRFYAGEVPIPPNGELEIMAREPDGTIVRRVLSISPNQVLEVLLATVELDSITVTADNEEIAADGESTTIISATVIDVNREAAPDGTQVAFTTSAGTLSCPQNGVGCVQSLGGTKVGTSNGVAQVVLKSSSTIESAQVTAGVDDLTGEVTVQFLGGQISVIAYDEEIPADGEATTTIEATVLKFNQEPAIDGTEVVFSTTAGALSCSPDSSECEEILGRVKAQTMDGIVQAVLKSSLAIETATITATLKSLSETASVDFVAGVPDRADVTANPLNLTANGSQTSTINAVVYDATGRRLEGRSILFSLDSSNIEDPSDMGQLDQPVATTSQAGIASVVYTAPTKKGTVTISASDEESGKSLGSEDITLIEALVANIEPSTGADEIIADGKMVLVAATVTDFDGNAVSDGTAVTFTTSAGTFDGATGDDKTLIEPTTIGGRAAATLISPTNVGTANITITAGGVWATTSVDFIPGAPDSITASTSPSKLTVGQGESSTITVMVRDKNNNLVPGETVLIGNNEQAQDQGQMIYGSLDSGTAVTDANGTATFQYTPPSLVPEEGEDVITVQTTNGMSATVEVQLEGPRIASIALSLDPTSLPADGESQAIVSATLTLVGGDPAPEDTPVYFKVKEGGGSFGENIEIAQSFTVSGEAIARLKADDNPGTAIIQVATDKYTVTENGGTTETIGGIVQEIEIEYTPGSISLLITPNVVLGTGQQNIEDCENGVALNCVEIIATLTNEEDLPAVDERIEFSLDGSPGMSRNGTIQPQQADSGEDGSVKAWYMAPDEGGEVTVTATWNATYTDDAGDEKVVKITETGTITVNPPPASINVVPPETNEISVRGTGGQETVQLFFDVKDNAGAPVMDGYRVDFEIVTGPGGGELVTPVFDLTEGDGRIGTVLRSGYRSGPVSIKATYFHDSTVSTVVSQVLIKAGPPVGEAFGLSAQFNNISGLTMSYLDNLLTASVVDYYGNAVPEGTSVSFKTYNTGGLIEEGDQNTNTAGGIANSTLFSTPAPLPIQGFVSVTAETIGGRTTHVTSIDLAPVDFSAKEEYVVFVGTDGGGVYKSTNSGKTWENHSRSSEHPGQNWIAPYVNDISIDRDEPKIVYAATGYLGQGNVYRSLDGGLTWNSGSSEEWNGLRSYPSSELYSELNSAASVVLCDYDDSAVPYQNFPFVWVGSDDNGIFISEDGVLFKRGEFFKQSKMVGKVGKINDIVRVPNTHYVEGEEEAILYAATASGIYKSLDSGFSWRYDEPQADGIPNPFFGDHVNVLALNSSSDGNVSDILYAGTEDAGVWVSTDSGKSWKNYTEGLGEGLMATSPLADIRNKGTGTVTNVSVGKKTLSENWTLEYYETICVTEAECEQQGACPAGQCEQIFDGFTIKGSDTGIIPDPDNPNKPARVLPGEDRYKIESVDVSFKILEGSIRFADGDRFTFKTIRNPGLNIKELLLDETNNRLYAVTYFEPENFHAVGNLYYYELKSDGSGFMKEGALWMEASEGLPQFDPPDDQTLFAQHAMALMQGTFGNTKSILIGGEGINFYKAAVGLDTPSPDWQSSKSGLNNTIMARRPILFSGTVSMEVLVAEVRDENGNVRDYPCYSDCENPYDPSTCDMSEVCYENEVSIFEGDSVVFHIYVQDWNGNPPLAGSTLSGGIGCVTAGEQGVDLWSVFGSSLLQRGTQSDPDNPETAFPFIYQAFFPTCDTGQGRSSLRIEFDPLCEADSPGCSFGNPGGDNLRIFQFTATPIP